MKPAIRRATAQHEGSSGRREGMAPLVLPILRSHSVSTLFVHLVWSTADREAILTPNLDEAAWLLGKPVRTLSDTREAARALRALGVAAVLVKGGHLEGDATDVLLSSTGESLLASPRIAGPSPRGTGCALATAIAVNLARGETLERAVASAKTWLTQRIAGAVAVGDEWHL